MNLAFCIRFAWGFVVEQGRHGTSTCELISAVYQNLTLFFLKKAQMFRTIWVDFFKNDVVHETCFERETFGLKTVLGHVFGTPPTIRRSRGRVDSGHDSGCKG